MTDETLKLVWTIPVLIFATITIFFNLFKELFVWIKEKL